jgi:hypothetical protein
LRLDKENTLYRLSLLAGLPVEPVRSVGLPMHSMQFEQKTVFFREFKAPPRDSAKI